MRRNDFKITNVKIMNKDDVQYKIFSEQKNANNTYSKFNVNNINN